MANYTMDPRGLIEAITAAQFTPILTPVECVAFV